MEKTWVVKVTVVEHYQVMAETLLEALNKPLEDPFFVDTVRKTVEEKVSSESNL